MNAHNPIRSLPAGAAVVILLAVAAAPTVAATLELSGPVGATVTLNERVLGRFPLDGPLDLPPGRYTIYCRLAGYQPYEQPIRLAGARDWQRVAVRLTPFSRRTATGSNLLLAGLGQHYLGHGFRGYVYNAAEAGGLLTALAGELQRSNLAKDYALIVDLYNSSVNADDLSRLRAEAAAKHQDMKDMESLRDTGLFIAGSAVAISIIDALLTFPAITAGGGDVPVETDPLETAWSGVPTGPALHAGLRLAF